MPAVDDVFIKVLQKKNLQVTRQRKEIFNAFLAAKRHLSVEELYGIVKKRDPRVGQTTVFRTLKLLCDSNIAKVVDFGDKVKRYEVKHGDDHHDHLVCLKCGSYIEAVDPEIESLQRRLCRRFGFTPERHRLEIYGICDRCAE